MHDLIPLADALPGTLTELEIDRAMHFARSSSAPSTLAAYASDFADWTRYALARGGTAMPAHPGMIATYISHLADSGLKASTIGRRVAAIAFYAKQAGYDPPPTASAGVRKVLKGVRREIGAAKKGKAPIVATVLLEMLRHCPDTLAGKRDAALLSLCFAGAFRRSEVCALEVEDLTATKDGLRIRIKRSKTDQTGEKGQEIAVIRGVRIQPVAHVEAWLAASGITEGPIFRAVALGDRMSVAALRPNGLARLIKRYCRKIGIDPAGYSGHSMRSGYVTSAVEVNAPLLKIAEQTRHASLDMLRVYSRRVDLFKEHSGAGFL